MITALAMLASLSGSLAADRILSPEATFDAPVTIELVAAQKRQVGRRPDFGKVKRVCVVRDGKRTCGIAGASR